MEVLRISAEINFFSSALFFALCRMLLIFDFKEFFAFSLSSPAVISFQFTFENVTNSKIVQSLLYLKVLTQEIWAARDWVCQANSGIKQAVQNAWQHIIMIVININCYSSLEILKLHNRLHHFFMFSFIHCCCKQILLWDEKEVLTEKIAF